MGCKGVYIIRACLHDGIWKLLHPSRAAKLTRPIFDPSMFKFGQIRLFWPQPMTFVNWPRKLFEVFDLPPLLFLFSQIISTFPALNI